MLLFVRIENPLAAQLMNAGKEAKVMGTNQKERREEQSTSTSHHDHGLLMVICCAVPLALIVGLSLLGILGSWGYYGLILLCPVMHFFLMRKMH